MQMSKCTVTAVRQNAHVRRIRIRARYAAFKDEIFKIDIVMKIRHHELWPTWNGISVAVEPMVAINGSH